MLKGKTVRYEISRFLELGFSARFVFLFFHIAVPSQWWRSSTNPEEAVIAARTRREGVVARGGRFEAEFRADSLPTG